MHLLTRAEDHHILTVREAGSECRLDDMENTQREARVSDEATEVETEESRTPEPATVTVARMLANPRRIRRN